jgi:DNA polymerase III epsilon subunit-like protein
MSKTVYVLSLDCEATGLSKYSDQIVEIGLTIFIFDGDTFKELAPFREYVRPTRTRMSKGAIVVTGITDTQLQNKPTVEIVLENMLKHINQTCINTSADRCLLAYNGFGYDIPLIVAELSRYTNPLHFFRRLKLSYIVDILYWSKEYLDKTHLTRRANGQCSYKLGDVYRSVCGKKLQGAHGALEDCRAVVALLRTPPFEAFVRDVLCTFCTGTATPAENNAYMTNPISFVRTCVTKGKFENVNKTKQKSIYELLQQMTASTKRPREPEPLTEELQTKKQKPSLTCFV